MILEIFGNYEGAEVGWDHVNNKNMLSSLDAVRSHIALLFIQFMVLSLFKHYLLGGEYRNAQLKTKIHVVKHILILSSFRRLLPYSQKPMQIQNVNLVKRRKQFIPHPPMNYARKIRINRDES